MTAKKTPHSKKILTLLSVSILALSACQSATTEQVDTKLSHSDAIAAAIQRAENASGIAPSLATLEKRYKRNTNSEIAAAQFAHALRKNNMLTQAALVLEPFSTKEKASVATITEYGHILLAQGEHKKAEKTVQSAILKDAEYDRAYHALGIALDAQGMHKEAERAFRKGLELWKGNPTTIMNNLALNLASQNHLEEAAEILQRALTLSPDRREIRRNLRIVTALQQSHAVPAPKPISKPEIKS